MECIPRCGICSQTSIAFQVRAATSQEEKIWFIFSVSNEHTGHKIHGMSIPLFSKFNLVGIRSNRTRHTRIFTFLGTSLFQRVRAGDDGRTALSIQHLVDLTENNPWGSRLHHQRSLSSEQEKLTSKDVNSDNCDCSIPPLTILRQLQNQPAADHRSEMFASLQVSNA